MNTLRCTTLLLAALVLVACTPAASSGSDQGEGASAEINAAPADTSEQEAAPASVSPEASAGHALDPTSEPLVKMAAQLNAAALACGDSSQDTADEAAAQSRQAMTERGYSTAEHDRIYMAEFEATHNKFEAMPASEQRSSCAELKQFGQAMQDMASQLQEQGDAANQAAEQMP